MRQGRVSKPERCAASDACEGAAAPSVSTDRDMRQGEINRMKGCEFTSSLSAIYRRGMCPRLLSNLRESRAGIEEEKYLTDREDIFLLRKGGTPLMRGGVQRGRCNLHHWQGKCPKGHGGR